MAHVGEIRYSSRLLSICIPTYNRSQYLRKSLNSLVTQNVFINTESVEIVISDNFSSDDTKIIVEEFIKEFGSKIKYSRTNQNIFDKNIERALNLGEGEYLKLANDTLIHLEGSLDYFLWLIQENISGKKVIFFSNGLLGLNNEFKGSGIDHFIKVVSYYSTWIASFGIWKSDLHFIRDFGRSSHLQLIQLDILLELVQKKNDFIVFDTKLFSVQDPFKKGGYDIITVFLDNYSYLLSMYLKNNNLSKSTYDIQMQIVVKKFIINGIMLTIFYPNKYKYYYKNAIKRIVLFFQTKPLFLLECVFLAFFYFFKHLTKKLLLILKLWK